MIEDGGQLTIGRHRVPRLGYGTMRLPGPGIFGPPPDRELALAVLRRAVELGVRLIDSAWYYGPDVSNQLVREALFPYPPDLLLVTKLGASRGEDGSWGKAQLPSLLRQGCERDLRLLGLDSIPVVHLRWQEEPSGPQVPFETALATMLELKQEGKIQHLGLSNVSLEQLELARQQTEVVCVSNRYSLTSRADHPVLDRCSELGIAYLPFFPLEMGNIALDQALQAIAGSVGASPAQLVLAWLLQRSPVMAPIPGTSSLQHLEENVAAASLVLSREILSSLEDTLPG